jgi:conjugal transfer pilus assembly protein TraF
MNIMRMVVIIVLWLFSGYCLAENYYTGHAVGWHWYDDPMAEAKTKNPAPVVNQPDPTAEMSTVKKTIQSALDEAMLEPTSTHVEHYITLQNELTDRAEKFSDTWQQVLLKHPELNYSLSHPTNNVALQVYHEKESKDKDTVIKAFSKQTGLFFFYRSTCMYCQRFAPILKSFAEKNGMTVVPITLDGIPLPEFPNSKKDSGQAAAFHVTVEPSLFAVNPYNQKAYPVAYGLTSEAELRDNIYKIVQRNREGQE